MQFLLRFFYYFEGNCTVGALIQQHAGLKCTNVAPKCPLRYISTDAYQCKRFSMHRIRVLTFFVLKEIQLILQNKKNNNFKH